MPYQKDQQPPIPLDLTVKDEQTPLYCLHLDSQRKILHLHVEGTAVFLDLTIDQARQLVTHLQKKIIELEYRS